MDPLSQARQDLSVPRHIAIIMDGNGRWARAQGRLRIYGHRKGAAVVHDIVEECHALQVEVLTLYAFSEENWSRPKAEIQFLMALLNHYVRSELPHLLRQKIQLRVIGDRDRLPPTVLRTIDDVEARTREFSTMTLNLAIGYGGRQEICHSVGELMRADGERWIERLRSEPLKSVIADLSEAISEHVYTAGQPDPDLVIRTGGEFRVSNFLLWQISYAEFVITEKCWPEFTPEDLMLAIEEYSRRERRFGGVCARAQGRI